MSAAAKTTGDQAQQCTTLDLYDPVLALVYFFNGADERAPAVAKRLSAILDRLSKELDIHEPLDLPIVRTDSRYIRFAREYPRLWSSENLGTLIPFYIGPSQVWCVQLALPVHKGCIPLEDALDAWQDMESRLQSWGEDLVTAAEPGVLGTNDVYWGSSRLYWALSDEIAGVSPRSMALATRMQSVARPSETARETDQDDPAVPVQVYVPQGVQSDHGALWRLDEPATSGGAYEAAWFLLSPRDQDEMVTFGYVLNGRFAIGEAYLCKAHNQAGEYAHTAQDLRGLILSTQNEISRLLQLEDVLEFAPDQAEEAQVALQLHSKHIREVAVAYSQLLFVLSVIDRLHLTVKTNLENYGQTVTEFALWDHPAAQAEIARLWNVLKQIEHDQQSRRASLQGFQMAIETVRADLELSGTRLSVALLDEQRKQTTAAQSQAKAEQRRARASEIWNVIVAILATVLGVSQVVPLLPHQRSETLLYSLALSIVLVLLLWILQRIIVGQRKQTS